MGISVVRYRLNNEVRWGVVAEDERVIPIEGVYDSLSSFLLEGAEVARQARNQSSAEEAILLKELSIMSPITEKAQIVCQGANYGTHRKESGLEEERPPYNLIFTKASSSVTGAYDDIISPPHVQLLDYEIELGLVIGKEINGPVKVSYDNMHEYVAGLVIANDVSARDIQLLEMQWYKGKSYRTFCPVGPYLYLLDKEEIPRINDLNITLWVNGELRQSANTSQLLFKPVETLTELSEIMNLSPGDLVLTGTTGGVALKINGEIIQKINSPSLSHEEKIEAFVHSQKDNGYLQKGDTIRCEITSSDGTIHLGVQENKVKIASFMEATK